MEITVKHNINDISEQVYQDCKARVENAVKSALYDTITELKQTLTDITNELAQALKIDNARQAERIRRAYISNIDKWAKAVLK